LQASIAFSHDGKRLAFAGDDWANNHVNGSSIVTAGLDGSAKTTGLPLDVGANANLQKVVFSRDDSRVVLAWRGLVQSGAATGGAGVNLASGQFVRLVGLVGAAGMSALVVTQTGNASAELLLAPLAGSPSTKLSTLDRCAVGAPPTTFSAQRDPIAISPDGTRAIYTDVLGDLILANLDTGVTMKLVEGASGPSQLCSLGYPRWAPDGTKVGYQRCKAGECETLVITPTGDLVATLGKGSSSPRRWFFSPDSKKVVAGPQVFKLGGEALSFKGSVEFVGGTVPDDVWPATFPWIDASRFVVKSTTGLDVVEGGP
jgi:hypothetical protein